MGGKDWIKEMVGKYGHAYISKDDIATYFPGVYSVPSGACAETPQQQLDKFCWEHVLMSRVIKPVGHVLFWRATDEEPRLKEQP